MSIPNGEQRSEISIAVRNGKVILSADQVLEIYKCKLAMEQYNNGIRVRGYSVSISRMYKVSPKSVRDIWNHITWKPVTCHLWRSDMECFNETPMDSSQAANVMHLFCFNISFKLFSRSVILFFMYLADSPSDSVLHANAATQTSWSPGRLSGLQTQAQENVDDKM